MNINCPLIAALYDNGVFLNPIKKTNYRNRMKLNRSTTKPHPRTSEVARRETLLQQQAAQKYEKFKKSASLPSYYMNKARLKKITEIYRTLSSDKLHVHSTSKSRRQSPTHTTDPRLSLHTPFNTININAYLESQIKPKRLTLQRGNENVQTSNQRLQSQSSSYIQTNVKLRVISDKLQELLSLKSEESFSKEFQRYEETLTMTERKNSKEYSQKDYMGTCFKLIGECHTRKLEGKVAEIKKNYAAVEEEISNLQVEVKKKAIRAILDQKDIEKLQNKNKALEAEMDQLKIKLNPQTLTVGMNTDTKEFTYTHDSYNTNNIFNTQLLTPNSLNPFLPRPFCTCQQEGRNKLTECLKKLQSYSKRQKELLAVLVVLRSEGIDIERVYEDVVSGKVEVSDEQNDKFMQSTNQIRQNEHKMYKQARKIKANSSCDGDISLISSADGLSYDFGEQTPSDCAFTIRHEYTCKKDLGEEMRARLRLNLDVLYDDELYEDDYESDSTPNAPTI